MNPFFLKQSASTRKRGNRGTLAQPSAWHPAWLLAAPHRLAFFLAAIMLAVASLWWLLVLSTQALQWPMVLALPVSSAHSLLMSLGCMPLFFSGFLFTAGPKWLGLNAVSARTLMPALAIMMVGWAAALAGFYLHTLLAAAGIVLVASGWTALSLKFTRLVLNSQVSDRVHPALAALASLFGSAIMWLVAITLALDAQLGLRSVIQMGLWWFIAPVFAIMSHRMIPFLGASTIPALDAWRPMWLLGFMLTSLGLEGLLSVCELWWWPLPSMVRWLQVAFEVPVALLMLWLAMRWSVVQNLKIRMLAMLHGGFVWMGVSFALYASSHWRMAQSEDLASLGLAPLHAMTMGYLGITMLAMITRVSSGNGGRAESADRMVWALYWALQTAVVLRVVAALTPVFVTPITLLSIFAWCMAMVGWAIRYSRWFGAPRPDGRPG